MLMVLLLTFVVMGVEAQRKWYNPRMRLIGLTQLGAQRGWTTDMGFMFVPNNVTLERELIGTNENEIESDLNRLNIGKKVLDYLFQYDGVRLSESLLKSRAYRDSNVDDKERADLSLLSNRTILEENYLPILENNYIYVERKRNNQKGKPKTGRWYIFHVEITKETLNEVFNCWNDMELYKRISVPVKCVKRGKIPKDGRADSIQYRKVGKAFPKFALRAKVTSRNPFKGNIGKMHGIKNGDRFFVMRTFEGKEDAKGIPQLFSKKIATTRATTLGNHETIFHTIAGGGASAKNADVLVYRPDKKIGVSMDFLYIPTNKMIGSRISVVNMIKSMRHGWTFYSMSNIGFAAFKLDKDMSGVPSNEIDFCQTYLTVGPALGFSFLRRLELVPYLQVGLDFVNTKDRFPGHKNANGQYDYVNYTFAGRGVVGARLNINVFYPLQITGGAEYFYTIGNDIYDNMTKCYKIEKGGFAFFGGIKYNF